MRTVSLSVANYCVPCRSCCRYCLLNACHQASGVSYARGKRFFQRLFPELSKARPDLRGAYYIGYCMDTPDLMDYIHFSREIDSASGEFLQMNGFAFRSQPQWEALTDSLREAGVSLIDLTFYGLEAYHDRFAGRQGDYAQLCALLKAAGKAGLPVRASMPLIRENAAQAQELMDILGPSGVGAWFFFLPHSKGRGMALADQRLTRRELDGLSPAVQSRFNAALYQTEAEWLQSLPQDQPQDRHLTLVLTADKMDHLDEAPADAILGQLEALDDQYRHSMPPPDALARKYGNPANDQLFRFRDLLLLWQQRFIRDTGGQIWDMRDETHHFSVYL